MPRLGARPAQAMQCQCGGTLTLLKNAAAGTEEEWHTEWPERENERQRMKGDQYQEYSDRSMDKHVSDKVRREQENLNT